MFSLAPALRTSLHRSTTYLVRPATSRAFSSLGSPVRAAPMSTPKVMEHLPGVFMQLMEAKQKKGLSFEQIAKSIGRSEWYTAAIFYGQAKPEPKDLDALAKALDIPASVTTEGLGENFWPTRGGLGPMPPSDPTIYRLYEAIVVYGFPLKHIIHEKFGDGIMSLIDFNGDVEKVKGEHGEDRVKITFNGKFLPYKRW